MDLCGERSFGYEPHTINFLTFIWITMRKMSCTKNLVYNQVESWYLKA